MPDPDSSPPLPGGKAAGRLSHRDAPATPSLGAILRERIERDGPMGFADFMAAALYDPALGYYARETRQVGRGGDFFTSVSVGPLLVSCWPGAFCASGGNPDHQPAGESSSAALTMARWPRTSWQPSPRLDSQAFRRAGIRDSRAACHSCRQHSRRRLLRFKGKIRFIRDASELFADPLPGVAFGNELLDALPFHVVERKAGQLARMSGWSRSSR